MALLRILDFARQVTAAALVPGDAAIDATVGNGYDTLHLARCVGEGGRVYGFDVQAAALAEARRRLHAAGHGGVVTLFHESHADLAAHIPAADHGAVGAVMFNLGYLPGGDKQRITRPGTTLDALEAAAGLLRPRGVLTVVCYTGHPGGAEEADAVAAWARRRSQAAYQVLSYAFINQRNDPPRLLVIEKRIAEQR